MSEDHVPPSPPAAPPPPPLGPPPPAGSPSGDNRTIMIILSYLGILALIPLLVEKEDREVQWHAKHGLVLFGAEIILFIVLGVLTTIPILGCVISVLWLLLGLAILVFHIMCMVKGVNGERLTVPYVSEYADKF
jgi:uncharacterized membrane protein